MPLKVETEDSPPCRCHPSLGDDARVPVRKRPAVSIGIHSLIQASWLVSQESRPSVSAFSTWADQVLVLSFPDSTLGSLTSWTVGELNVVTLPASALGHALLESLSHLSHSCPLLLCYHCCLRPVGVTPPTPLRLWGYRLFPLNNYPVKSQHGRYTRLEKSRIRPAIPPVKHSFYRGDIEDRTFGIHNWKRKRTVGWDKSRS